jgi:hypothetical protein
VINLKRSTTTPGVCECACFRVRGRESFDLSEDCSAQGLLHTIVCVLLLEVHEGSVCHAGTTATTATTVKLRDDIICLADNGVVGFWRPTDGTCLVKVLSFGSVATFPSVTCSLSKLLF